VRHYTSCFEAIPHDRLIQAVEERISDRHVLKLLRAMLRAGVMEDGQVRRGVTGTPQGGVVSPLLANVYLHRLDREWQRSGRGALCRYADDLVVMCATRQEAEWVLLKLTAILAEMGLEPKASKTRIVHLKEDGEGLDFLGFHHRWVRASSPQHRHVKFLARWPSNKAMARIRERIRQLTARSRISLPILWIVEQLNQVLRGWAAYFRYGNSARQFSKLQSYARMRLALVIAKRHRRSRAFGWSVLAYQSTGYLGLYCLDGIVVAPRPFRAWRERPNAGGQRRR